MKPDARYADTRHTYFLTLLEMSALTQVDLARRIGICPRALRYYVAGERQIPYPVQFALESLVDRNERDSNLPAEKESA